MIYRITIHDNDFHFIMKQCMDYLVSVFNSYLDLHISIFDIFKEYLEAMHIEKRILNYILENLKIEKIDSYISDDENSEVYYFFSNYSECHYICQ